MNTHEPTRDTELIETEQPEIVQESELTDEELETVDGGLLPAVRNKISPVIATKPESHGIIAVLIGL